MNNIRAEFDVHILSPDGLEKAQSIARVFSTALTDLEALVPPGRERALVVTKLQLRGRIGRVLERQPSLGEEGRLLSNL